MTQEDETPDNMPPRDIERDVLAERRARRGELQGDTMLARRAELAEETARALEGRLSGIQERLRDAERECASATERLTSREQELRSVSERLVAGERELRSVSGRLTAREQELRSVSERLATREQDLRLLSQRLVDRERELREAELEIRDRIDGLEGRLTAFQTELTAERTARIAAERELGKLQSEKGRVEQVLAELKTVAKQLREVGEAQAAAPETAAEATVETVAKPPVPAVGPVPPAAMSESPTVEPEPAAARPEPPAAEPSAPEPPVAEPSAAEPEPPAAEETTKPPTTSVPSPIVPMPIAPEPVAEAEVAVTEIGRPGADVGSTEISRPGATPKGEQPPLPEEPPAAVEVRADASPPAPQADGADEPSTPAAAADEPSASADEPSTAAAAPVAPEIVSAVEAPVADAAREPHQKGMQMAEALASAVERLKARVASVGELNERREAALTGGPPTPAVAYVPPLPSDSSERRAWLAPAIRQMAEHGSGRLAGELIIELLPAQAPLVKGTLRYLLRIEELGGFEVELTEGSASVRSVGKADGDGPSFDTDFTLEGPAAAFAEFAGGGVQRRPRGLRVPGRRRRARRLFSERRKPVSLADLADSGVQVWPGLLLAALAEAVDPAWTITDTFTVAFSIEGHQSALLDVGVRAGLPLRVTRVQGERAPDQPAPVVTVRLGERGFMQMISGKPLPEGERVLLQGDAAALERLLAWTDRVQGIRRFDA
jgi:hypothetical protein